MKRKVKAWAIIASDEESLCGHMKHFEIHATQDLADRVINTVEVDGLSVIPVTISYELPRKARKKV